MRLPTVSLTIPPTTATPSLDFIKRIAEGQVAWRKGEGRDANPYPKPSEAADDWDFGWTTG